MKENQQVEWKRSWRDDYLRWVCGFANAKGGSLVIGRDDKGVAVGVRDAARLMEEIPNKVRDILGIMVDVNLREEDGRELVEIRVEPHPNPVSYKGEYCYRSGSTNQTLKGGALDRFLLRKRGLHWDGVPVPHVAVTDLSKEAIDTFRKMALENRRLDTSVLRESAAGLLEKLKLVEANYLKRAALLLFHPDPERFVTASYVKIGFFRDDVDLLYHDEVHGHLFHQAAQTIDLLLTKYLRAGISYRGIQRIETLPVPEDALREAVLNALIHKDYSVGAPIQIKVYPYKLSLWNAGVLPEEWTLEDLLGEHSSRPFNPDIANAFFRAGEIEAWGRGIRLIFEACQAAGSPEPTISCLGSDMLVEFPYPEAVIAAVEVGSTPKTTPKIPETTQEKTPTTQEGLGERAETPVKTPVETPVKTTQETTATTQEGVGERVGEGLGERLGETRAAIVRAMLAEPSVTTTQLAAALKISTTAVEKHLRLLRSQGYIQRVGPARGGHWEVLK